MSTNAAPVVPLIEACCDSVHTARAAQQYGAGRVELCGPGDGGTTPSLGLIARCREELTIPLHVMIRPHTRSFVYDEDDLDVMCNDIITARSLGVSDKDAAVAKQANLIASLAQLLAKANELAAAKAKREAKKKTV